MQRFEQVSEFKERLVVKPDSNSDKEDNARCNGLNRSANSKSVWLP